ncbi:E3 ubiquitin-protein ligase RNF181 isoform X3 [Macaca fascicularis]|uniref:E3 ubiquitin-protein ligase RNF181 isoform X2 n=1 Tax=Macaca mulatta TaxID=9544 RepID=UPI0010A2A28F|nr:E3 ubiquitin-protein ligase RNF181 isoform X2 [Macaca mulatta]XP_028687269.1 E3 ubiquitin-protein ligase RNF181 isoform X2 [Macaca mulatta]XP_037863125.1 E3 ubiquitin-protein ligase RNF181 isoform X3 [Chlorocebus sabaeus]
MASYFDEHDCEPSDPEQETRTNMLLELARSLFNRMDFEDLGLVVDWDHHLPPPAAKNVVENLPRTVIRGSQAVFQVRWGQVSFRSGSLGGTACSSSPDQRSFLKSSSAPCVFWNLRRRRLPLRCLAITFSIPAAFCPG